jgi:hypothetical protein
MFYPGKHHNHLVKSMSFGSQDKRVPFCNTLCMGKPVPASLGTVVILPPNFLSTIRCQDICSPKAYGCFLHDGIAKTNISLKQLFVLCDSFEKAL